MFKRFAILASVLWLSGLCLADTLDPAHEIIATFSTIPGNNADLLMFFSNDPLIVTGSPVLTLTLYNGATALATITASPYTFGSKTYIGDVFEAPGSPFIAAPLASTTINFSSINSGTISGELVWTISGGSLSGFNISDFELQDVISCGTGCYSAPPNSNTGGIAGLIAGVGGTGTITLTPEPSSLLLLGTGLIGGIATLRRRIRH